MSKRVADADTVAMIAGRAEPSAGVTITVSVMSWVSAIDETEYVAERPSAVVESASGCPSARHVARSLDRSVAAWLPFTW